MKIIYLKIQPIKIFNLLDAEIEKIENLTKEEMNLLKDINIEYI